MIRKIMTVIVSTSLTLGLAACALPGVGAPPTLTATPTGAAESSTPSTEASLTGVAEATGTPAATELSTQAAPATVEPTSAGHVAVGVTDTPVGTPSGPSTQAASGPSTQVPPGQPTTSVVLGPISSDQIGQLVEVTHINAPGVRFISVSPLGDTLAAAQDNTIYLYAMPVPSDKTVKLDGHTGKVNALSWSPDGTQLVSASDDGTVRLWDTNAGQQLSKFDIDPGGVTTVAWSSDGLLIAAGDVHGTVHLLDGTSGDQTMTVSVADGIPVTAITWSSDGSQFAVSAMKSPNEPGTVVLVDADTGKVKKQKAENYLAPGPSGIAWSPSEDKILWVNNALGAQTYLWDLSANKVDALAFKGQSRVVSVTWGPDGDMLATGGFDHNVVVWSSDGSPLTTLKGHSDTVTTVAWSPDGTFIASAGLDNVIRVWGIPAG